MEATSLEYADGARRPVPGLVRDDQGAILVLGIFMCACMVGMLWYLAGIGDAIVYRERMQAGADAAAFSGAVLHARGMNLIVLLNIIMACILGIRVALKVVATVLFVVGAILTAIPFPVPIALGNIALQVGRATDQAARALKQPIDSSIKALNAVQEGIARVVPPASIAGSYQVGERYGPIVRSSAAGSPLSVRDGLPVVDGSEDKLCEMAGRAFGAILTWKSPIPSSLAGEVEGMLGKAVRAGGAYFCEIGSGGSPPDFSEELNAGAERGCNDKRGALEEELREADAQYRDACTRHGANCDGSEETGLTVDQQAELGRLLSARDAKERELRDFDRDRCIEEQRRAVNENLQNARADQGAAESSRGQGLNPQKVRANWHNGIDDAQVVAVAVGNEDSLNIAPRGVRAGAWQTRVDIEVPRTAQFTIAQAEFFFDCDGAWTSNSCNGPNADDSNAMWQFRWRARLRRYNTPFGASALDNLSGALMGGEMFVRALRDVPLRSSLSVQNAALVYELGQATLDLDELIIH